MAKDFNTILSEAQQIKNEIIEGANTALRTGTCLEDIVQRAESDEGLAAKKARTITAGNGLTGGGSLATDMELTVGNTDDSIVVGADGIKVDTQDSLTSTSITKPLSAAKGKALQDTKANKTVTIEAGNGLTGGGDLSGNRTLNIESATDGITPNADNIQLNTIDALDSTSATKPLSANQGKVLNEKVVQVETDLNNLLATYTHNSNYEVSVSSLDNATGTFTKLSHQLSNGDIISPIINIGAGGLAAITVFPSVMPNDTYYVVESTENTFKISETVGGSPVTFVNNPTIDLTKWHFEKVITSAILFNNLPNIKGFRIFINIRTLRVAQFYIVTSNYNSITKPTETNPYSSILSYNSINLPKAHLGLLEIQGNVYVGLQYSVKGNIVQYSSQVGRMDIRSIDRYVDLNINRQNLTGLEISNAFFANGTIINLYKN